MDTSVQAPDSAPPETAVIASALRWWRDAGVDVMIDEMPRQWLTKVTPPGAAKAAPRAPSPSETLPPPAAKLPATREALVSWLATSGDVVEGGLPARRVLPSGDPTSPLMVLSDFPDHGDIEAGHLLSGELGELFDKMLAAIGHDRSTIYLASVAPTRPATGQLNGAALAALGPIACQHAALIAPKQLWVLGSAASRAILGISDLQAHGSLHSVNLNGHMIETVATAHPRFLTDKDKKRRAWTEMQRLNPRETA